MLSFLFKRFAGRHYKKFLEKARPTVIRINELETSYQSLTDEQLSAKTDEFRARLKAGETLDQLLPEYREAIVLREIEGLTYKEIASVTGAPIGTVMSRLARARRRLQEALGFGAREAS